MTLCKRLIARLDIKGSRLIKGIRFEGLRVLGEPREAAIGYASAGADELLYIDAVASLYGRNSLVDLLKHSSREVFIPITAGGGVRSVSDAAALLAAGADKIAVNTSALQRPELISELAKAFGSQCVVASIQARRIGSGTWAAMAEAGREHSGREVLAWIEQVQQLGAGEILLTSVDQDGTCAGTDEDLQEAAAGKANVPLVVGGGFASGDKVLAALELPTVTGVSIGAALHRKQLKLEDLKRELAAAPSNPPIRQLAVPQTSITHCLNGHKIGVIDYGMGNQQSLINALEYLGATAELSGREAILEQCDLVALPGVGAFPKGMAELNSRGLLQWLQHWVHAGRPLIGICLGMQMLFETSDEFSPTRGLGLLQGQVVRLPDQSKVGERVILPHMGWNNLEPGPAWIYEKPQEPLSQYFVHSYVATGVEPENVMFNCYHGDEAFVAAVKKGTVVGFQFHPERSGPNGLALLAQICEELLS